MPFEELLTGTFVYLAAAVIAAPVFARLGSGSVLGYLVAGVVIGPWVLGLVGDEGHGRHALRRVRRRDDAVPRRARAAAGAAVAAAPADLRARRPAGRADGAVVIGAAPSRSALRVASARSRSASTLAMSSTAIVLSELDRAGPAQDLGGGAVELLGAAVPGHRGHPDPRGVPAARRALPAPTDATRGVRGAAGVAVGARRARRGRRRSSLAGRFSCGPLFRSSPVPGCASRSPRPRC